MQNIVLRLIVDGLNTSFKDKSIGDRQRQQGVALNIPEAR